MDSAVWDDAGRWFDGAWYLIRNPDVARAGLHPMRHYLRYGEAEGRKPSPWFDPVWYRATHDIPAGQSALAHFLERRRGGQVTPDAALWLVPHTAAGRAAIANGDDPFDLFLSAHERPEHEFLPVLTLLAASGLIGADYHVRNRTAPPEAMLDPALHYCRIGWRFGFQPNDGFDPVWYDETNPEVVRLRIDPLLHYAVTGERSGRRPIPWFDPVWYREAYHVPPEVNALAHYLQTRRARTTSPNALFDPAWYVDRFQDTHGITIPEDIDPFAHYLVYGAIEDIDPSPRFDARSWRHRNMAPLGAPGSDEQPLSDRNPLVHHLRLTIGLD